MSTRAWVLLLLLFGCGGKIDGGKDAGVDAPGETSPPVCKADNSACSNANECCSGYCDSPSGTCLKIIDCTPDLASCSFDSDCCSGLCAGDGLCGCVQTNETGCTIDSDCCSTPDICVNGVCQ